MASSHARKHDRPVGAESPVAPQEDQHAELAEPSRMLAGHARSARSRAKRLRVVGPNGETLALPASVVEVLERETAMLSNGDVVSILPVGRELTTQQAANLLNVSRQYVVRLVNEDRLPCTRTGKHRRLRMEDVLAFKRARDLERRRALTDLTRLTEEFGGYDREMK
jgi:excisionase family DNA binding protein